MNTSERASINAKSLGADGFDAILSKLLANYTPDDQVVGERVDTQIPPNAMKIFSYIKARTDKKVCLAEDQQQGLADEIKDLADQGGENNFRILQTLLTLINTSRVDCVNCINTTCTKRRS